MTIQDLKDKNLIIFHAIVGSQSYGIATPTSDTDTKGVYIQPIEDILSFGYCEQVSDEKNDNTFYEIQRFLQLLQTNNPTVLELLSTPEDCVLYKDSIFDLILEQKEKFITIGCRDSFGGYAIQQIKKARGMNKKIVNPVEPERKSVLDFCYVPYKQGSIPVKEFLKQEGLKQEFCGLVSIDHMRYTYGLYYDYPSHFNTLDNSSHVPLLVAEFYDNVEYANSNLDNFEPINIHPRNYRGIVSNEETSNDVVLSDIPKGETQITILQVNLDGYSTSCKKYKEYFEWVEKRNPQRYADNIANSKNYDGKNLAHCHRLLDMAIEIISGKGINVRRDNREELLAIRRGEKEYDDLIQDAERKIQLLDELSLNSTLPKNVDKNMVNSLLLKIRKVRYELV